MIRSNNQDEFARLIIRSHINKAFSEKLVQWNDGLNYTEFIQALWRLFLNNEHFKPQTLTILEQLSNDEALQLLADEIDITKLRAS